MELDDVTYKRVTQLSESGNRLLEQERYDDAISVFQEALECLPMPWAEWEAATWLYTAIGDAYFLKENYSEAKDAFFDALNCPEALDNPFIHLRLGQSLFELGEYDRALDELLQAYMLDAEEVFEGEPSKYFEFLKQNIEL